MIGLTNAGGIAMARQDGDFNIDIDSLHAKNEHKGKNCTLYFILLLLTLFVKFNATKSLGIIHRLPAPIHNSLLIMARNLRPRQDREDSIRFKAQRDEKRRKNELALAMNLDKAIEEHVDILFRWDKHLNREFWNSEEQVNNELSKIKGVVAQRNTLKDKITEHVKGLGWKEYHTNRSF